MLICKNSSKILVNYFTNKTGYKFYKNVSRFSLLNQMPTKLGFVI